MFSKQLMIVVKKVLVSVVKRSRKYRVDRPNLKFNFEIKQIMMDDK